MGIELYAFALFIAGLICLVAILCKMLFANVKKQHKLLDEKETKLLQLYQTVESIMEEFNDQAAAATNEIMEYESRAAKHAAALAAAPDPLPPEPVKADLSVQFERLPRSDRVDRVNKVDPGRLKAANEALARAERIVKRDTLKSNAETVKSDNGAVFQRLFDETVTETQAVAIEASSKQLRSEAILALAEEGKTDAEIAQELSITQNEVKLVIGLTKRA